MYLLGINAQSIYFTIGIFLAVANTLLLCFASYRFLQSIQLNSYRINRYSAWLKKTFKNYHSRLLFLALFSTASLVIINILFYAYPYIVMGGVGLLFYFIFVGVYIYYEYLRVKNTPIVYTPRAKRLIFAYAVLLFVLSCVFVYLSYIVRQNKFFQYTRYIALTLMPLFIPVFVGIAAAIMWPFEELNNRRFIKLAKSKLDTMPELIKIAVVGSYAKTSVKNILEKMLSKRYNVLSSPLSYNTPMGLCKIINKSLNQSHQVLIAEMGAKNRGDIKLLCSFVKPQYAIVTGVGNQHLETFSSVENIKAAKYEVVENITDGGFIVFNGDNETTRDYYQKCKTEKYLIGIDNTREATVYATDIKVSKDGSSFTLYIDGQGYNCVTKMLGKHNVLNILMCATTAYKLGVAAQDIVNAIEQLEQVKHRLNIITNQNGVNIIDDSYNSSREGSRCALDVLAQFDSNRIIITPGLIELGEMENRENYKLGLKIAKVADYAVLVGEKHTLPIKEGLVKSGFDINKIIVVSSRSAAVQQLKKILKSGDTVLFENDLPDNYTEE